MLTNRTIRFLLLLLLPAVLACACNRDNDIVADALKPEIILTGCDDSGTYYVHPGMELTIAPDYRHAEDATFVWTLDGATVGSQPALTRTWTDTGLFTLTLTVTNDAGSARELIYVSVQQLTPPVISLPVPDGGFRVEAGAELLLAPQFRFDRLEPFVVRWFVDGKEEATGREFAFSRDAVGQYALRVEASNADGTTSRDFAVSVVDNMLSVSFPPVLQLAAYGGRHVAAGLPASVVPLVGGFVSPRYDWTVGGASAGSGLPVLVFTPSATGPCDVGLTVTETEGRNRGKSVSASTVITVCPASAPRPATAASAIRLSAVLEYLPAPGQFIDEDGSFGNIGHAEACLRALQAMQAGNYVSLGAYGGYIVAAFDHSVVPSATGRDLAVGANCFTATVGSSNEPGTVWVACDANANGLPDDEWYLLRGSDMPDTPWTAMLDVTYMRPDAERMNVGWTASDGTAGTVDYLPEFHDQPSYYPAWAPASYTLRGISLPALNYPEGGTWTLPPLAWGYADNMGSDTFTLAMPGLPELPYTGLSLANAIAADGTPVDLPFVDFVMVRSATLGKSGWLGEISTEVIDIIDATMLP